jgi:predicted AlkP superfamily pyrophosphatase or phosphodiesterase
MLPVWCVTQVVPGTAGVVRAGVGVVRAGVHAVGRRRVAAVMTPGTPTPLLPDFGGACLTGVVPGLLGHLYRGESLSPWMPTPVAQAEQIVLLIVDGLGSEQLAERSGPAPVLTSGVGGPITSVAPSTTACALTSLATGRPPADHGIVGYRVAHGDGDRRRGEVMNILQWTVNGVDARMQEPAHDYQPCPAFPGSPDPVPVVTRHDFGPTGFTAAYLGDAELHRWHTPAGLVTGVRKLLGQGRRFVWAYYEGIDKVAHARGLGEYYDDELRATDRLVGDLLGALSPGAALVVTADHGQVDVGGSVEVLGEELMHDVTIMSGEGRFRWLHVRPGTVDAVAKLACEIYADTAWVRTRTQMIEEGWFGGIPSPRVEARLGDVALIPFTPTAFLDPADTGELRLMARHGSLTPAEMLVPLLSWPSA